MTVSNTVIKILDVENKEKTNDATDNNMIEYSSQNLGAIKKTTAALNKKTPDITVSN